MGTVTCQKNRKICAFCKHWNGNIGSTTMVPISPTLVRIDLNEKQTCWKTASQKVASFTCSRFEPRF